jgi:hypothetical protein
MTKYRKKPVVIEAWKWPENEVPEAKISMIDSDFDWICKECGHLAHEHGNCPTLEGYHIVCPGDMIIKGIKGEFYPCKPDIFEKTYEKVEESEGEKMKPDGVSDNVYNDLINALDKAITLIYTILNMSTTSTRNAVVPWDTIHRWENLVRYAREKEAKLTNGKSIKCNYFNV